MLVTKTKRGKIVKKGVPARTEEEKLRGRGILLKNKKQVLTKRCGPRSISTHAIETKKRGRWKGKKRGNGSGEGEADS